MNLRVDVKPDSTNERVLKALEDNQWHSSQELKEKHHLTKNELSAGLFRLVHHYGYIIERRDRRDGEPLAFMEYCLIGRANGIHNFIVPPVGTKMTLVGTELIDGTSSVKAILQGEDGTRYTGVLSRNGQT